MSHIGLFPIEIRETRIHRKLIWTLILNACAYNFVLTVIKMAITPTLVWQVIYKYICMCLFIFSRKKKGERHKNLQLRVICSACFCACALKKKKKTSNNIALRPIFLTFSSSSMPSIILINKSMHMDVYSTG